MGLTCFLARQRPLRLSQHEGGEQPLLRGGRRGRGGGAGARHLEREGRPTAAPELLGAGARDCCVVWGHSPQTSRACCLIGRSGRLGGGRHRYPTVLASDGHRGPHPHEEARVAGQGPRWRGRWWPPPGPAGGPLGSHRTTTALVAGFRGLWHLWRGSCVRDGVGWPRSAWSAAPRPACLCHTLATGCSQEPPGPAASPVVVAFAVGCPGFSGEGLGVSCGV